MKLHQGFSWRASHCAILRYLPKSSWLFFITALIITFVDQLSKSLVINFASSEEIVLFENLLTFRVSLNSGSAFSIGSGYTWLFTTLALLSLLMLYLLISRYKSIILRSELFVAGVFCGGVAGNLVDRLFRTPGFYVGHVVDFISVGNWPTFNLADSAIFISVILYLFIDLTAKSKRR